MNWKQGAIFDFLGSEELERVGLLNGPSTSPEPATLHLGFGIKPLMSCKG
jgi:hypothetical protein